MPFRGNDKQDAVAVVEAAYSPCSGQREWLERVAAQAQPMLGGDGAVAYTMRPSAEGRLQPEQLVAIAFPGGPSSEEMVLDVNEVLSQTWPGAFFELMRLGAVVSLAAGYAPVRPGGWVGPRMRGFGFSDAIAVVAAQPGPAAVVLVSGLWRPLDVTEPLRRRWGRITAHVAAGQRLIDTLRLNTVQPGPDDAVLEASTRVTHAGGEAKSRAARERLRIAAKAMDRARGRTRRDPEEALELWQALVLGRWSLVEQFDSDGRRYIIARKNEPWVTDPRGLTLRERQVAAFASLGQSDKLIGYALGLSASTVATHLASALRKLRLGSRTELALLNVTPTGVGLDGATSSGTEQSSIGPRPLRGDHAVAS